MGPRPLPSMPAISPLLSLWLLSLLLFSGCQPAGPIIDHYAKAQELAAQIKSEKGLEDYSDAAYEVVMQELQLVPEDSANRPRARSWLKEIQKARRAKLFKVEVEDYQAYKAKPTKKRRAGNRGAPPGWNSYEVNVDVAAIRARVSGGQPVSKGAGRPRAAKAYAAPASYSGASVTIYTTSWCGICKAAKAYMRQKGVSYIEKDIEKDSGAKAEAAAKTGGVTSVPIIDVNGQIMVGFEKAALDRMLAKAGR